MSGLSAVNGGLGGVLVGGGGFAGVEFHLFASALISVAAGV